MLTVVLLAALLSAGAVGCSATEGIITFAGESRQKGIELYNQTAYTDAAGAFQDALRQDPRDYQSSYYLGRSYEAQKQYHLAVPAYRTALDVMAQSLVGREDEAFRLKVLDGLASAAAAGNSRELEQAALKGSQTPTAEDHLVRAKIYRNHGDVDSALEAYNRAALADPDHVAIAKEYGLFLAQAGQNQKASGQLTRAYVLNHRARKADDPQVVAALRGVGVVPGPSLGNESDLAQPPVPVGPLPAPEDLAKLRLQNPFTEDAGQAAKASAGAAARE